MRNAGQFWNIACKYIFEVKLQRVIVKILKSNSKFSKLKNPIHPLDKLRTHRGHIKAALLLWPLPDLINTLWYSKVQQ